jgi:putative transposase
LSQARQTISWDAHNIGSEITPSPRPFQFWQEGSQPKVIETEATLRQKLEYIHNNPVKRGYVSDATHWRYSSARNYARMELLVDVAADW